MDYDYSNQLADEIITATPPIEPKTRKPKKDIVMKITGAIFKNEKRNENSPDYTINLEIDGHKLRVAMWSSTTKDGRQYWSLKGDDDERQSAPREPETPAPKNDGLPF